MLPIGLSFLIKCYEVFLSQDQINVGNNENIINIYSSRSSDEIVLVMLIGDDVFTSSIISSFNYGFTTLEQVEQLYDDYHSMDDNQLILTYGRDPFDLNRKLKIKDKPEIDLISIIQKLLEGIKT